MTEEGREREGKRKRRYRDRNQEINENIIMDSLDIKISLKGIMKILCEISKIQVKQTNSLINVLSVVTKRNKVYEYFYMH